MIGGNGCGLPTNVEVIKKRSLCVWRFTSSRRGRTSTTSHRESFDLIRTLCTKRGVSIQDGDFTSLEPLVPLLLTPGAAESLAVKVYRQVRTSQCSPLEALRTCLTDYQTPVAFDTLEFQIRLAVNEASDLEIVPAAFRGSKSFSNLVTGGSSPQ